MQQRSKQIETFNVKARKSKDLGKKIVKFYGVFLFYCINKWFYDTLRIEMSVNNI